MIEKESFRNNVKMQSLIIPKSGPLEEKYPIKRDINLRKEYFQNLLEVIKELERTFHFSYKRLRRLARSQLFILLKKYVRNNAPDLYLEEIKKLLKFELTLEKKNGE